MEQENTLPPPPPTGIDMYGGCGRQEGEGVEKGGTAGTHHSTRDQINTDWQPDVPPPPTRDKLIPHMLRTGLGIGPEITRENRSQ